MENENNKCQEYTDFWDNALGDSQFSEEDIVEMQKFIELQSRYAPMEASTMIQPEPAIFVSLLDYDDDLPF